MSGHSTPKSRNMSSMQSQSSFVLKGYASKYKTKKKKTPQSTLLKRNQFKVFDLQGHDRTPKLLYDPDYQTIEEWQPTILDYVDADMGSNGSQVSLSRTLQQTGYGSRQQQSGSLQMSMTNITNMDSYKEPTLKTLDGDIVSDTRSDEPFSEVAPSQFRLKDLPSRQFYPPHSKVPIVATETNSFTLFSLKSSVQSVTAENADELKKENEIYEFFTFREGRYQRKLQTSEQQTPEHINTTESSYCPRKPTQNDSSWVTNWKLHDEHLGIVEEKKNQSLSVEEQWSQLVEDEKFITHCMIMDRLLGMPQAREFQLNYKNPDLLDPLDLNIEFKYLAKALWTYETAFVQKKPALTIAINTLNPDIIAVGYGKFLHVEIDKGFICIWNAKNLKHPERNFKFPSSVMCVDFAKRTPNLLAAGFLNGDLLILDISTSEKKIAYSKSSVSCNTYEKILSVKWCTFTDIFDNIEERLMLTTGCGRIIQLRRRLDKLIPFQMMRITKAEEKVKGIDCLRKCEAEEITMVRFPPAHQFVYYPNDNQFYLVSGSDGIIRKCSVNYFTQHVESFLAHLGPIYALKFSPFCAKIFLTCGADSAVRLWVWDIFEPVMTLTIGSHPVEDADWSPRNTTVIASISDCNLYLWDLKRKTYYPTSTIEHPQKIKFCTVKFSNDGNNVILGDMEGSVYYMSLHKMPFVEKFKEHILAACIERELIVKPKLLKLVKKSGPPFTPF